MTEQFKPALDWAEQGGEMVAKFGGLTLTISRDEHGDSPRDWDNLGVMECHHGRYNLGDGAKLNPDDFGGWDEMERHLINKEDAVVILPLYLYDHGGISISTDSFIGRAHHAEWDSGRVGFIYATRRAILEEYNCKRITRKIIERVTACLRGEVETYDQYLRGDVYGYAITNAEGNDVVSLWGLYGLDYAMVEAEQAAKLYADTEGGE